MAEIMAFLRHKKFADPEVMLSERATLSYFLPADQILPLEYPRKVSFRINYTLDRRHGGSDLHFS